MAKHYVTFGQYHKHKLNGKVFDKDCVAVFDAENAIKGRKNAFEYFGVKFCFEYHNEEFDQSSMRFFPRGFINLKIKK